MGHHHDSWERVETYRSGGFNSVNDILIPEELANVAVSAASQGVVGQYSRVQVDNHVVVGSTAIVVTREDGLELDDTVGITLGHSTQEGGVEVGRVGSVAVAFSYETGIDSSCIAVPDVPVNLYQHV